MEGLKPFENPIYITRPLLPDLDAYHEHLQDIWDAQYVTNNGPKLRLLEERLKEKLDAPNLMLFNNGTIAHLIALRAAGIKGEVITTPFTFPATNTVFEWLGDDVKPVFCDIDPETMNIDPNKIEALITPETSAIVAVHLYGIPCDIYRIQEIAEKYGLMVVYDAAHAFNSRMPDGTALTNYGDISMVSLHATKLFNTIEGGALIYKDPYFKRDLETLRNFGISTQDKVYTAGLNGKLSELHAAIGLLNLDLVDQEYQERNRVISTYTQRLEKIEGIKSYAHLQNSNQYFIISIDADAYGLTRNALYEFLKRYNVMSRKYFYHLACDYPFFKDYFTKSGVKMTNARELASRIMCLPMYGAMTDDIVHRICDMIEQAPRS